MSSETILSPQIKHSIASYAKSPPHALLLHGRAGSGLTTTAMTFAQALTKSANIMRIQPDETGSIKVRTVRELYEYTRTKQDEKLVIILDDADTMQPTAQNALLKLLEEPPQHVAFILTTHRLQYILPTIQSRAQAVQVPAITKKQSEQLLDTLGVKDDATKRQLLFIAQGLPAELTRLVQDKAYFERRVESFKQARDFMQGNSYQKLIITYKIGSNRDIALALLDDTSLIIETSLREKPQKKLVAILDAVLQTQDRLRQDGNVRAQLLRFSLQF